MTEVDSGEVIVRRGEEVRSDPRVSVIVPVWRETPSSPCWLDEALDSVRAQTFASWELIVVDDGSPEPVVPARLADVVLVRQPNTGPGGARNRGVAASRGELLAFLDADDRWRPRKLELQVALHDRRPELTMSATGAVAFDATGAARAPAFAARLGGDEIAFARLFAENCVACSSTVVPRAAYDRTPGMSPRRRMGEDYGLWLRLAMLGPVGYVDDALLERRVHASSLMQRQHRDGSVEAREREVYDEFLAEHPAVQRAPFVPGALARIAREAGWTHLQRQEWSDARRQLWCSLGHDPIQPKVWADLARAALRIRV